MPNRPRKTRKFWVSEAENELLKYAGQAFGQNISQLTRETMVDLAKRCVGFDLLMAEKEVVLSEAAQDLLLPNGKKFYLMPIEERRRQREEKEEQRKCRKVVDDEGKVVPRTKPE